MQRWWRWTVRAAAVISAVVLLVVGVLVAVIVRYGTLDHARSADVIIVLGGGEEGTVRRAEHGAALYHQGYAPFVACAGGGDYRGLSEAEHCAKTLIARGVPQAVIVQEDRSRSTEENARAMRTIMARRGWQTALLVTDRYHLWRARWLFGTYDITVYTSPAQITSGALAPLDYTRALLREIAAVGWHAGKSLLGLPYTDGPDL